MNSARLIDSGVVPIAEVVLIVAQDEGSRPFGGEGGSGVREKRRFRYEKIMFTSMSRSQYSRSC